MKEMDYEILAERVEAALVRRRRLSQLIMSGVGVGVPILLVIIALIVGSVGGNPEAPQALWISALFVSVLMHFFTILLALGAFDKSLRANLFNEEMSAHLLEMAQRNRQISEKAKRSLEDLGEDYEIMEVEEDGEIAPRRMRSEDA